VGSPPAGDHLAAHHGAGTLRGPGLSPVLISLLLCASAAGACFLAARKSPLAGLCAILVVGYLFGIVRGNFPNSVTYFLWDASAVALYAGIWSRPMNALQRFQLRRLLPWFAVLSLWPTLLLFIPVQNPLLRLLGFRSAVFFLPFLLIGAMLAWRDVYRLALWVALLDLMAFAFAGAEFLFGIEPFFPKNAVTGLIYNMALVDITHSASDLIVRIPACFSDSAHYGMAMVVGMPLLLGAWVQPHERRWHGWLLISAVICAAVGTFLSASRTHTLILVCLLVAALISSRVKPKFIAAWMIAIAITAFAVSQSPRLQRIFSLQQQGYIGERISWSINEHALRLARDYPLGNGLGGGGTVVPYFLASEVETHLVLENEYVRIMIEQGIPGLALWLSFLCWVFLRRPSRRGNPWMLGRRLAWFVALAYFATAGIGIGLLISIPGTAMLFVLMGWLVAPQPAGFRIVRRTVAVRNIAEQGLPEAHGLTA
jgi:hypothetical protein